MFLFHEKKPRIQKSTPKVPRFCEPTRESVCFGLVFLGGPRKVNKIPGSVDLAGATNTRIAKDKALESLRGFERGRCRQGWSDIPPFLANCSSLLLHKEKKKRRKTKKNKEKRSKVNRKKPSKKHRKHKQKWKNPSNPIYANPIKNLPNQKLTQFIQVFSSVKGAAIPSEGNKEHPKTQHSRKRR